MFPDSDIAKKFACGSPKATAIIKEDVSPYYHNKTVSSLPNYFSILIGEWNDKSLA